MRFFKTGFPPSQLYVAQVGLEFTKVYLPALPCLLRVTTLVYVRNLPKLCFLDSPFDGQRKIQNQPHENKPAKAAQDDEHRLGVARGWG